ncbi:MAG: vitamin B12 transporter [Oceanicoccus sp.]
MNFLTPLFAVFFWSLSLAAHSSEGDGTVLDTISITATDLPAQNSLSKQYYPREYFIGKFQSVSDVLQTTPGVQVRASSYGTPPKISIRGSSHKQVTFIIDGQVINSAQSGGFNVNQIPLQQIESIEIHQNSHHSVTGAIGGIIIISTISPKNKSNISMSYGSFNHQEIGASMTQKIQGDLLLSFNHVKNNGDYQYPVPSPIDNPNDKNRIEEIKNNQYKRNSFLAKWNSKPLSNINIDLKSQVIKSEKGLPNFQMNNDSNIASLEDTTWSSNLGINWNFKHNITSQTNLGISQSEETYSDPKGIFSYKPTLNKYNSEAYYLTENIRIADNASTYNVTLRSDTENFKEDITLVPDNNKCIQSTSICDAIASQQKTSLSFVHEYIGKNFETSINMESTWLSREQDNHVGPSNKIEDTQQHNTWSVAYQNHIFPMASLRLDLNKGIRLPSIFELFGDRGLLKSNPTLLPESSLNSSIELILNEFFVNNLKVNISSSLYKKDITDAIVPIYSGSIGSYSNTSSATLLGWQTDVSMKYNSIGFTFQSSKQDSETESIIKSFNNKKLAGIFHNKYMYGISWSANEIYTLSLIHQVESELYIDMANLNPSINNESSGLKFHFLMGDSALNISVNNIFNNENYDKNNRPTMDRNILVNVQHQF